MPGNTCMRSVHHSSAILHSLCVCQSRIVCLCECV
jgi:hypothetical protein